MLALEGEDLVGCYGVRWGSCNTANLVAECNGLTMLRWR